MRWTAGPSVVAMLASAILGACASQPASVTHPAPVAPPPSAAAPPAGPSERECDALITHAVALGIDEQAARGGEPATTEADHEAVRRQLHEELVNGCRALTRDAFRCASDAASLPALAACQPSTAPVGAASDQRTPSSSTSNSKVAPGGITPPAPRSP